MAFSYEGLSRLRDSPYPTRTRPLTILGRTDGDGVDAQGDYAEAWRDERCNGSHIRALRFKIIPRLLVGL